MDSKQLLAQATEQAKNGRLDQAIEDLKTLLTDVPDHEIALGMLGGIYAQIGMHERAIDQFGKVLSINPDQPLARLQLGIAQIETQRYTQSLETLAPLRDSEGDYAGNFYSGLALMQLNRPQEAKPLLQKAAENMPQNHPAYPELRDLLARDTDSFQA